MLPVFLFGEYKWPFRCCTVVIKIVDVSTKFLVLIKTKMNITYNNYI